MKNFILILMSVFTISAFGSTIPDVDVGDPIVVVDVHDIDVLNIQTVDVATVDSIETHSNDAGTNPANQMIKATKSNPWVDARQYPQHDVGWYDEPLIATEQPPSQFRNGSAGGNPGWHA